MLEAALVVALFTLVAASAAALRVLVEVEEQVYSYNPSGNGSGPTWCHGSSCIVRVGDEVFISGVETLPEAKPLNNVRWQLWRRNAPDWEVITRGEGRTREPCPLVCFADRTVLLSDNPTLAPDEYSGPAQPEICVFDGQHPATPSQRLRPVWDGEPQFTEHSYRSFAADGKRGELILFQNIGYTHAEWSFRDGNGDWAARGQLIWPWGAEYPKPEPIRVCYPTVALKDRKVYYCGVSDIIEPYPEWRAYKKEITGREWDYDFRRLFFTWSDDIATGAFHDWIEVSSRDQTCGWIMPCDLWVAPEGTVHLLWTEKALDERLRGKFFPSEKQGWALMHALVQNGRIEAKQALVQATEEDRGPVVEEARFHVTPEGRLFVFFSVSGTDGEGERAWENRLLEIRPNGTQSEWVKAPLQHPIRRAFTTTWRAGCAPAEVIDIYGVRAHEDRALGYARIRLPV